MYAEIYKRFAASTHSVGIIKNDYMYETRGE